MIIFCAVTYSVAALVGRGLIASGMSPAAVAFYRFVIAAVATSGALALSPSKRSATVWGLASGVAMGIGWLAYMSVVDALPVATLGVIYLTYPMFTMLTLWLVFGRRPSARAVVGGLVIVTAAVLALGGSGSMVSAGGAGDGSGRLLTTWGLALVAPITFGLSVAVLTERLVVLDPFERLAGVTLGGVVGLLPLVLALPARAVVPQTGSAALLVLAIGVGSSLLPMTVYSMAAPCVGGTRAAAAGSLELPSMFVLGWLILGEPVSTIQWMAGGLILMAVLATPVTGDQVEQLDYPVSAGRVVPAIDRWS